MRKALVIDDDEMDLELLRIILSKEGYTVFSTADGPQGVTLYKYHHPTIVFLDLGLPSMSGIEVLQELKRYDDEAKVFLITGYGSEESEKTARRLGAMEFIEKSWDIDAMMSRIQRALQNVE